MPAALRETGSITIRAPQRRVYELLRDMVTAEGGTTTTRDGRIEVTDSIEVNDRIEAKLSRERHRTFVVRSHGDATQVIVSDTARNPSLFNRGARETLKQDLATELFEVRRLFEAADLDVE